MSKADKVIKHLKDQKPTFGTDPNEQWSAKANIEESEAGLLKKFLKSRGINPQFVSKDQKIAHSKTGQFAKWKQNHIRDMAESITTEPTPVQKRASLLSTSKSAQKEVKTPSGPGVHKEDVELNESIPNDHPANLEFRSRIKKSCCWQQNGLWFVARYQCQQ